MGLFFILKGPSGVRRISVESLLRDIPGTWDEVGMERTQDGRSLCVTTEPKEKEYPGMTVDATDEWGNPLYLGNFEFPNETFPESMTGRLYAGYASFESDGPIALVSHNVSDAAKRTQYEAAYGESPRAPKKLVYVDKQAAEARDWIGEPAAEHVDEEYGGTKR